VSRARTLGVLGGGQLGRMFVQAAQSMGFETVVLCADSSEPAAQISSHHIAADYNDRAALEKLAAQCCAVTTEFENVPSDSLAFLAAPALNIRVSPTARAVRIAQDRVLEKAHFAASGVPTAPYHVIETDAQIAAVPSDFYPAILKTARMGYDGKGQDTVNSKAELQASWNGLSQVVCVLEKRLALASEYSVLLARDETGGIIHWPLQRNVHVNGILSTTEVAGHADIGLSGDDALQATLVLAAKKIATDLAYVGVLCIEFFILADGSWVVNEMAPRPHNSGHVTMNASSLSQFEAQVRVAAGLPLVQPRQHSAVVMMNLLGEHCVRADWAKVLALGSEQVGVHLHLYGKGEARIDRKMGHINITAHDLEAARTVAQSIQKLLGAVPN
jgi:5-(carboxyamino)imidazole ribonucleotide synthase